MTQREKLIKKILQNKRQVRFEDLEKILLIGGFEIFNITGSHYTFKKPGELPLIIVKPHGGEKYVKKGYIEKALKRLQLE